MQRVFFPVIALLFTPVLSAATGRTPDLPSCIFDRTVENNPTLDPALQKTCPSPSANQAPPSRNVVHASELRRQFSEMKLSSDEIRNLRTSARTSADHRRLAGYYSLRAESDLAQAMESQKIALKYSANPVGSSSKFVPGTVDHCVAIGRRFKQHAAKMRSLQKEQEQLARDAGE